MTANSTLPRHIGDQAEALAARYLQAQGLQLIARNYVRRIGEIDLILHDPHDGAIVFVEVRYRRSITRFGDAIDSISAAKRNKLRRTAGAWLQKHADSSDPARIDVLAIQPETVRDDELEHRQQYHLASNPSVSFERHQLTWIVNAV